MDSESPPRWTPPRASHKWKALLRRALCFDLHLLISIPLFIVIFALLILEGCLYFLVRFAGRLVEKWSYPPAVRCLLRKARRTEDFATYRRCAERLDELTGRDAWKSSEEVDPNAPDYDISLVRRKSNELLIFRNSGNIPALVQCVKTCLETQLVSTLNPVLYSLTFSGTKALSEQLQQEVIQAIEYLTKFVRDNPDIAHKDPDLFAAIRRLPKDFGSTALIFSGGAMLGLHHFGLLEALIQNQMLPKIICGTSAGSAVAAFVCTRSDEEVLRYLRDPEAMTLYHAPFVPNSWILRIFNYFKLGHSMDVKAWLGLGEKAYGYITFLEAYQLTGRVLNISVTRAGQVSESIVLNYKNAPNVMICSAVIASSAFPYLGFPVHLMEKDPQTGQPVTSVEYSDRYFQDGSLRGDVPVVTLRNRWGVNFILVSQVNPHVFPFLGLRTHGTPGAPVRGWGSASVWRGGFPLAVFEVALKEHLRYLLRLLALLEIVPPINGIDMTHLALQDYGGDVNVYPPRFYWPHIFLMNNVPRYLVEWFLHIGRQMVFPKMWMLKARLGTETSLQRLAHEMAVVLSSVRSPSDQHSKSTVDSDCSGPHFS